MTYYLVIDNIVFWPGDYYSVWRAVFVVLQYSVTIYLVVMINMLTILTIIY